MTQPNAHQDDATVPSGSDAGPRVTLRLLATTDLHMHIRATDRPTGQARHDGGLMSLSSQISAERAGCPNTLLLDNGDYMQGGPMGDLWADAQLDTQAPHPIAQAMNALAYDAGTLGNHEINFGFGPLQRTLSDLHHPVVCANLKGPGGAPIAAASVLLHRQVIDTQGASHPITIGIAGGLPARTAIWDRDRFVNGAEVTDLVAELTSAAKALRAEGADIVVLLAHTGIGDGTPDPQGERAGLALAQTGVADALVLGHTHSQLPDPHSYPTGHLAGCPAVMPGYFGTSLGRIDLTLQRGTTGWAVSGSTVCLLPPDPPDATPLSPDLQKAEDRTCHALAQAAGHSGSALHSYFGYLGYDTAGAFVAAAIQDWAREQIRDTALANLPMITSVPMFKAGGASGKGSYVDIPAGALSLRDLFDLHPFPNQPRLVQTTGQAVLDWAEDASTAFATLRPGQGRQDIRDTDTPSYQLEVLHGAQVWLDLSRPANPGAPLADRRVTGLTIGGRLITPDTPVLLAANNYRLNQTPIPPDAVLAGPDVPIRNLMIDFATTKGAAWRAPAEPAWRFRPLDGVEASLPTVPAATAHLASLPQAVRDCLRTSDEDMFIFDFTRPLVTAGAVD